MRRRGAATSVARAAELHDLGKVAIPDAILHKPGRSTRTSGASCAATPSSASGSSLAARRCARSARLVRSSHERLDGTGYPDGLAGDDIPLGARVVAVCDAFDAMTSDRPYRHGACQRRDALAELRRCAGHQFDPVVVAAFTRVVMRQTADAVSGRDHAV